MIYTPEPRLFELLLAFVFQVRIMLAANVSRIPCIESHYRTWKTRLFDGGIEKE
jgi:hypothetical protein